jgi:hypothetical protein
VLSREEIAAAIGTPEAGERSVDVQVTRLRRKIEADPARAALPAHHPPPRLRAQARPMRTAP